MSDFEIVNNIVVALINNNKIDTPEEAGNAYKTILKILSED